MSSGRDLAVHLGRVGAWVNWPAAIPVSVVRAAAAAIEDIGFSTLWCAETPTSREALSQAAVLLAATDRLVLATGIASIYARDARAAQAGASALAEAFPGRFVLGLGVSHRAVVERRGHEYDKPLTAMREYLDAMDTEQAGDAPRVLAALRPRMLELARTRAAGSHTYFVPPGHTERARAALGELPFLAPEQAVVLETDPTRARAIAKAYMRRYLAAPNYRANLADLGYSDAEMEPTAPSDRLVDDLVAWGDAAAIAERIAAHRAAGADHVCVQAIADDPADAVDQLRRLAAHLL